MPALARLQSEAGEALKAGPFSVVFKQAVPPSGNRHDYMSLAPYWWPNPDTPDGLPYVHRDGETNPERDAYDRLPIANMESAVSTLALAYHLTGNEPYAAHASKLIKAWFLDEATYMNPHANYGEAIRGITEGRAAGIIGVRYVIKVADAVGLLAGSAHWTAGDRARLEEWYSRYLDWLVESEIGKEESTKENNHGTWYEVQVSAVALFARRPEIAARFLGRLPQRIAAQVEPDGSQPLELKRTRSFHYSAMNVEAYFDAATLGEKVGLDLWRSSTPDGRGIRRALDFLAPYAVQEKPWPHPGILGMEQADLALMAVLLRRAAIKFAEPAYDRMIERLPVDSRAGRFQLVYPHTIY